MGRRKDRYLSPQKTNSIQDSVGNEENGYPSADHEKKMVNFTWSPVTST
jgi:hypothetical protein